MNLLAAVLTVLLQMGLPAEEVSIPGPDGISLRAVLARPAAPTDTPRAAVMLLHGCGGPGPRRDPQWIEAFVRRGHTVLMVDSFASRGQGPQCRVRDSQILPRRERRQDTIAAARWLAAQPGVAPGGVVAIGFSHGGSTALWTAARAADLPPGLFRGFVALYPGCQAPLNSPRYQPSEKILLLIGEDDDWTPPQPCRDLVARFPDRMEAVVYPGAVHGFDTPNQPKRRLDGLAYTARGDGVAWIGTNPAARADAFQRVPGFVQALPPR